MRFFLILFFGLFFVSCSTKLQMIKEEPLVQNDFNQTWWHIYKNDNLNNFVDFILENNKDLQIKRLNFLSALARYELIDFNLYPSLSGNLNANINKNLNSSNEQKSFSSALNLNYELDIYGKIKDESDSSKFLAKASEYELESLKLSIINMSLDAVFNLAYFNDVDKLLKQYISNLEKMQKIYKLKYEFGRLEELDYLNIEKNILNAKQNLLNNAKNKELIIKNLKDLIADEKGYYYINDFEKLSLSDFNKSSLNFDINITTFYHRPDVKANFNRLKSSFKDYESVSKSMYPSISLNGGLSSSSENLSDTFKIMLLGGNLQISLPFLDFYRVNKNIKISEFNYEILLLQYKQSLQSAINEFALCYKQYDINNKLFKNMKIINNKQNLISKAYLQKYEFGKGELKDYLDANNEFINSSLELKRIKFELLKTINNYYKIITIKP